MNRGDTVTVSCNGVIRGEIEIMLLAETMVVGAFLDAFGKPIKGAEWIVFDNDDIVRSKP